VVETDDQYCRVKLVNIILYQNVLRFVGRNIMLDCNVSSVNISNIET
jgi:hypothetical protein